MAAIAAESAAILQKTTSDPRFMRGLELSKEKRLEEAVVVFEDLLRTMVEVENKSDTLEIAPVYYEYGNSVLKLAEATASVFGQGMGERGGHEQQEEEEEVHGEDGDESVEQDVAATGASAGSAKKTNRDEDDFELAWEMLELARVIYSRQPSTDLSVQKELARVHLRLGDLGMEIENFPQARSDYKKSLVLQQQILNHSKTQSEEKPVDTTPLADLYCCLAISCIYQQGTSAAATANGQDTTSATPPMSDEELKQTGLKYYVLAGRVMAQNVHRVAKQTGKSHLIEFVNKRIPNYEVETGRMITDAQAETTTSSNGKGKQKKQSEKLELAFLADAWDTLKQDFMTCVQVAASLTKSKEAAGTEKSADGLPKEEIELLEFMEIYGELKEKVDGLKEDEAISSAADTKQANAVTTIGFGAPPAKVTSAAPIAVTTVKPKPKPATATTATATATAPAASSAAAPAVAATPVAAATTVNVLPVVKKRKIAPTTVSSTDSTAKKAKAE